MELYYNFAGISFKVSLEDGLRITPNGILTEFISDDMDHSYSVNISPGDDFPSPEGDCVFSSENKRVFYKDGTEHIYIGGVTNNVSGAYMYIRCHGNENTVIINGITDGEIPQRTLIEAMTAVRVISRNGGVLLHSSFIKVKDKAVLFTAPSGTGKSTQAHLWCKYENAELINGDRSVLYSDRVCGVPYCGSSRVSKKAELPIAAIVYLSQSPTDSIKKLSGTAAFRKIWEGCSVNVWNKNDVEKSVKTVSDIVSSVPIFHLSCTKERSAVDILKRELGFEK